MMRASRSSSRTAVLPLIIVGIVVLLAWMLSAHVGGGLLAPIQWLGRWEAFHLVAHAVIFGGIAWLTRAQGRARQWSYVLIGGILLEIAQWIGAGAPLSAVLLRAALFDLLIDSLGALAVPPVNAG
jgi:hypothetical protein